MSNPAQRRPSKPVLIGVFCVLIICVVAVCILYPGAPKSTPTRSETASAVSSGSSPALAESTPAVLARNPPAQASTVTTSSSSPSVSVPIAGTNPTLTDAEYKALPPQAKTLAKQNVGEAAITIDGNTLTLPRHGAHYERAQIARGQSIRVNLSYPADDPSTDVFAHAIQGGTIDGKSAQRFDLTQSKQVGFNFTPSSEPGLYEVLLRRGTQEEVLQFWVPTVNPSQDPTLPVHR